MICPTCKQPTSRIIIDAHGKACADCRGISAAGGARLDGILTRNSERIRAQQQTNAGDVIMPHTFDRATRQAKVNPDFVDKYPDQLPAYFTQSELEKAGYSKAGDIFEQKSAQKAAIAAEQSDVTYAKDPGGEKMKEVVKNA